MLGDFNEYKFELSIVKLTINEKQCAVRKQCFDINIIILDDVRKLDYLTGNMHSQSLFQIVFNDQF